MMLGAVDIGTNSMRLLIARVVDDEVAWVERRAAVTGLGRGVDRTGELAPERVAATVEVLAGYGRAMNEAGVARRRAVATSATRDASNRAEFLAAAASALGVEPDVISGDEEAALAFTGATRGTSARGPALVIDTGGGSTELVFGEERPSQRTSVEMGSVRLTDRDFAMRPAGIDDLDRARAEAAAAFDEVQTPPGPFTAIGVAGTFTSLAAIDQDLPAYDPGRIHGHRLTASRMDELIFYLAGLSVEDTAAIPSLDPARAPVLLAGAVVARAAMAAVAAELVVVSEHDILDGIVLGLYSS